MDPSTSSHFVLNLNRTTYNVQTGTWSGVNLNPLFHPQASLGQVIVNALSKAPFCVAQVCHEDNHRLLNWQILQLSVRVALHLRDLGLQEADVIGLAAGNSRYVAPVVFGGYLHGHPVSTLDPTFSPQDLSHIFQITRPKCVFCDPENYEQVKKALQAIENPAPIYVFSEEAPDDGKSVKELLKVHPEENSFVPPKLSDCEKLPAMIICTSGTSGPPKSIPIPHNRLANMFQNNFGLPTCGPVFTFSTLYWISGVMSLLLSTQEQRTRIIVRRPFDAKLMLEIVRRHQVGLFICPPSQLRLLLLEGFQQSDLQSLKAIFCGGGLVTKALREQFPVPVISHYGLTEGGFIMVADQLITGVEVKIIDEDGGKLGPEQSGEILLKSPFTLLGYYRNEAATRQVIREGFVHTGDIGYFDREGNLHLVDRKKDIFKYNNYHVNPSDIENVLQNMDGVGLVCVVGIPDTTYGGLPAAVIITKGDSKLCSEAVHQFAKENLSPHQYLRGGVYFVQDVPMTCSGKVLRRLVTTIALELFEKCPDIGFQY